MLTAESFRPSPALYALLQWATTHGLDPKDPLASNALAENFLLQCEIEAGEITLRDLTYTYEVLKADVDFANANPS